MTKRYFSATDGTKTYFRASATKVYRSAMVDRGVASFSAKSVQPHGLPAVEIDKPAYDRLVALKMQRVAGQRFTNQPSDSWVENSALAEG